MSRRSVFAFKFVLASICFLGLTVVAAFAIRALTGQSSFNRGPASLEPRSVFEYRGDLTSSELAVLGSTILNRGRRLVFHEAIFRSALQQAAVVPMNLFPDLTISIRFQNASDYRVNEGLLVGQVEGDPDSTVRMYLVNGIIEATITTRGREYRIFDGAGGLHFVTEAIKR